MSSRLASFTVFVAAGAVLVLETLAGRLLAPYIGVTLQTFTGIIGVVLAGIAVGTFVGGRMADRSDPRRLLPIALGLGADGSFRAPLGVSVIGGLVTSTLLSLVVVPAAYSVVGDVTDKWRARRRRRRERAAPELPVPRSAG